MCCLSSESIFINQEPKILFMYNFDTQSWSFPLAVSLSSESRKRLVIT